jgi:hypothetical protein
LAQQQQQKQQPQQLSPRTRGSTGKRHVIHLHSTYLFPLLFLQCLLPQFFSNSLLLLLPFELLMEKLFLCLGFGLNRFSWLADFLLPCLFDNLIFIRFVK